MAKRKKTNKTPQLSAVLERMTPTHRRALYRIAKDTKRGLRPFFTDAHAMIALRNSACDGTSS